MKIHVTIEADPRSWRRRRLVLIGVAILALAIPAGVWASHQFGDVPDTQPFHAQITSIANAGITTGCGGGNYCPDEFVRRDAMAAFMSRGFGRITRQTIGPLTLTGTMTTMGSVTITPGLPAGALPGAAGFIQADGYIQVVAGVATGCPCLVEAYARLDGSPMVGRTSIQTVNAAANTIWLMLPITGAKAVTTSGVHTVDVVIRATGTATWTANAELVASYFPFGGAGGNVLGKPAAGPASGPGIAPAK